MSLPVFYVQFTHAGVRPHEALGAVHPRDYLIVYAPTLDVAAARVERDLGDGWDRADYTMSTSAPPQVRRYLATLIEPTHAIRETPFDRYMPALGARLDDLVIKGEVLVREPRDLRWSDLAPVYVLHRYCCDPNEAMCGVDLTDALEEPYEATTDEVCQLCSALDVDSVLCRLCAEVAV